MFFKIACGGVAFVSNVGEFWAGSTSVEREAIRQGVYLTEYQLVKQRIGVIPCGDTCPVLARRKLQFHSAGCLFLQVACP